MVLGTVQASQFVSKYFLIQPYYREGFDDLVSLLCDAGAKPFGIQNNKGFIFTVYTVPSYL